MESVSLKIIKYLLAALFIYAGFYKITDVNLFETQMYESPLLPVIFIPAIALILPIFEIVIGVLLIFSKKLDTVLISATFSLMLFFSLYFIILYFAYAKPPCACGGILSGMSYPAHITFNLFFTLLAGIGIALVTKNKKMVPKNNSSEIITTLSK